MSVALVNVCGVGVECVSAQGALLQRLCVCVAAACASHAERMHLLHYPCVGGVRVCALHGVCVALV